jgi:hypothetical protein
VLENRERLMMFLQVPLFSTYALIAPNVFQVPGVPAVVQTKPMVPPATGDVFQTISPIM